MWNSAREAATFANRRWMSVHMNVRQCWINWKGGIAKHKRVQIAPSKDARLAEKEGGGDAGRQQHQLDDEQVDQSAPHCGHDLAMVCSDWTTELN